MKLNVTRDLIMSLKSGRKIFGQHIGHGNNPEKTVDALKNFGYDFILVENEHALLGRKEVLRYIDAAKKMDLSVWMRTPENTSDFRCYLDEGINGVMLPHVDTLEQASFGVNQSYFPPLGHRGNSIGMNPALIDYQNTDRVPYLTLKEYINSNTLVTVMTESLMGIHNLHQILRLDGVVGTVVGCTDLALDIGSIDPKALCSEIGTTPVLKEKLQQIVDICKESGKVAGVGVLPHKDLADCAKRGYQVFMVGCVVDGNLDALKRAINDTKDLIG